MNEVTKIHLGRQAYTISVDAHHVLKAYIAAIAKQVKDDDVLDEVEARMAELLAEHGISSSKVILPGDVDYLKSQLGRPADFADEAAEPDEPATDTKRLFRDTDNALVAGVAAGLARYFGLDVVLVRIVFVVLTLITVGWGILLYILLWLLVPEAKTSSERLQMVGKPVTVQSLKEVVEQADVKGVAQRANNVVAGSINAVFGIIVRLTGIAFIVAGLTGLLSLIAGETYFLARGSAWAQNNIFPIGLSQHILLDLALAVTALMAVFIVLFGIAIYRRRWPIKTWVTGILAGLILIGLAVGGALTADVYPAVHNAYLANTHTTTRDLAPMTSLSINGTVDNINFVPSGKYLIAFSYYGHPDINAIKTTVTNGNLLIDASNFDGQRNCSTLCFPRSYRLNITLYAPNALQLQNQLTPPAPVVPTKPY